MPVVPALPVWSQCAEVAGRFLWWPRGHPVVQVVCFHPVRTQTYFSGCYQQAPGHSVTRLLQLTKTYEVNGYRGKNTYCDNFCFINLAFDKYSKNYIIKAKLKQSNLKKNKLTNKPTKLNEKLNLKWNKNYDESQTIISPLCRSKKGVRQCWRHIEEHLLTCSWIRSSWNLTNLEPRVCR